MPIKTAMRAADASPDPDQAEIDPSAVAVDLAATTPDTVADAAETSTTEGDGAAEPAPDKLRIRPSLSPFDPLRVVGQLLMWLGALIVLFAVFQLWGTGLLEWRAQRALDAEFEAMLEASATPAPVEAPAAAGVGPDAPAAAPAEGPDAERPDAEPDEVATGEVAATAEEPVADNSGSEGAGSEPAEPTPPAAEPAPAPAPIVVPLGTDGLPVEGAAIGRIHIPSIDVTKTIVQGVQRSTLRDAPGHYPTTPLPGQPGNAAIAGHRTTHGAPFIDLDQVEPGDTVEVQTMDGVFHYEIQGHPDAQGVERGYFIVDPSAIDVISDQGDNRLTLTACHPKFSARQRIVVTAVLVDEPSDSPVIVADPLEAFPVIVGEDPMADEAEPAEAVGTGAPTPPVDLGRPAATTGAAVTDPGQVVGQDDDLLEASLGWQLDELDPTILWATATLVAIHAGWILGRLWRRRWAYPLWAPVVAAPLFLCFVHLDRLLPAY